MIQGVLELIYLVDFGLSFLLQYVPEDSVNMIPVNDISETSKHYIRTNMMRDLIPLIPFQYFLKFKFSKLFYLTKCIRIF